MTELASEPQHIAAVAGSGRVDDGERPGVPGPVQDRTARRGAPRAAFGQGTHAGCLNGDWAHACGPQRQPIQVVLVLAATGRRREITTWSGWRTVVSWIRAQAFGTRTTRRAFSAGFVCHGQIFATRWLLARDHPIPTECGDPGALARQHLSLHRLPGPSDRANACCGPPAITPSRMSGARP